MTSTGNDIVSLNAINSTRTRQSEFYSIILSTSEKTLYNKPELAAIPFENFVWLLWSIKESAFKYLQRNKPDIIFSPTKFIVQQIEIPFGCIASNFKITEMEGTGFVNKNSTVIKGTMTFGPDKLYSRSIMYKELIVSVVNGNENFENTGWGVKLINNSDPSYQSMAVREFLINRLHRVFQMDNLLIGKNPHGFPIVLEGTEERAISVSLSHHDHLVAYSFQPTNFESKA